MDAHPSDSSSHCTGISDFRLHLAACPAVAHWRLPQLVPPAARSSQRIPASFGRLPLPRKRGSAPKRLFYRGISLRHCLGTACNCSDCACHPLAMPIFSVSPQSTWSLPHACESSGVNLTRMYGVNGLCRASTFTSATSSARAEPFAVARLMGVSLVRRLVAFAVFSMLSLMRSCSLPVSTIQRNPSFDAGVATVGKWVLLVLFFGPINDLQWLHVVPPSSSLHLFLFQLFLRGLIVKNIQKLHWTKSKPRRVCLSTTSPHPWHGYANGGKPRAGMSFSLMVSASFVRGCSPSASLMSA